MAQEYVHSKVDRITFGLLSPVYIKKMASAKVVTPELYDREGYPVDGGLMDVRLGIIDPGLRCKTCGQRLKECLGHFGYIELARPVVHINYVKTILDVLKSVCRNCGRILMTQDRVNELNEKVKKLSNAHLARGKAKKLVAELRTVKKCPHCNEKQIGVKYEKPSDFMEGDRRLTPIDVRSRFEKIPDDDVALLGLNPAYARPEWMILTVLPIPPVTVRPSITLESGERSEDDLTHKLGDIVRINQSLFENINAGAPEIIVEDLWDLLQYHVTTYFDNTLEAVPPARHRSGQPLKTLAERIKSKEGRFRHNLAGKRVNFSSRTVISPDARIKFDEVGVPKIIAMELTIPERVTEWNIEYLKEFIKKGPKEYPGANYVLNLDGKKKKITDDTKDQLIEELQPGYVVERHLMNGDIAVFNRQPSLHRMSILSHKIKILPGRSFRLNPAVCTPYNADFDGDEMNLHIPQTEEARAEAEMLLYIPNHIITPKNGLNILGSIEDSITGCYLLTKDIKMPKEQAIGILYKIGVEDLPHFKEDTVDGKEVFSALLPKDFSYVGSTKDDKEVLVKSGLLIHGHIDKASIGEENGGLLRSLYAKYGEIRTINIMTLIFRLGIEVLQDYGFTIGVADTDLGDEIVKKNADLIKKAEERVVELIEDLSKNRLEQMPGLTEKETFEKLALKVLNNVRDKIGDNVLQSVNEKNAAVLMARSGAAGNLLNLAQMSACVGQQAMGGSKRIEAGYRNRTLSYFEKGALTAEAKGFVARGYKSGLKPTEYFFHAMTGRDSLMDSALRTPKSGYLYRRLANALQDLKVEYDFTVRDANKRIVQFKYGEDGIDVSRSEGGVINVQRIVKEVAKNA